MQTAKVRFEIEQTESKVLVSARFDNGQGWGTAKPLPSAVNVQDAKATAQTMATTNGLGAIEWTDSEHPHYHTARSQSQDFTISR